MSKLFLRYCLIAAVVIVCLAGCARAGENQTASDFTLRDLQGTTFTLSEYAHKQPVLMIFWTTWCPFCREELKAVAQRFEELSRDGLKFVAIDVGESQARVSSFAARYNFPFPILLDADSAVASAYNLLGVPTYVFVDKEGNARFTSHTFPEKEYKQIMSE